MPTITKKQLEEYEQLRCDRDNGRLLTPDSKWLSMMEKRLKLAKRLLNPADSVLIVTIDEKEYLHQYHPISLYISGDDI